jgi:hypothetical protein
MIGTIIGGAAAIGASLTGGRRASGRSPESVRAPRGRAARSVPKGFRARVASICATRCLLPHVGPFDVPAPGRLPTPTC